MKGRFNTVCGRLAMRGRAPVAASRQDREASVRQIAIIANPASGQLARGDADAMLETLHAVDAVSQVECVGDDLARTVDTAAQDADAIAIAGGDGTIRAVAEQVVRCGVRTPIIPLPLGTANLLARKLYGLRSAETILSEAAGWDRDGLPAGVLNDRLFLVAAAIGFPSTFARAREALRDKARPQPVTGMMRRAAVSARNAFQPSVRYRLDRNTRPDRRKASGLYLSLGERREDGFDCWLVHWRSPADLLGAPIEGLTGADPQSAATVRTRCERLVAWSERPLEAMVDGEPAFLDGQARIRVFPREIEVLRPAS